MNLAGFFDTETTGLPDYGQPSESPNQPHIVQLACLLVDLDSGKELQSLDLIVRPEGWTIPQEMTEVHGISQEMAMDIGVSEMTAVEALLELVGGRLTIAHNHGFDGRIIRIALKRYFGDEIADEWKAKPYQCTAQLTRQECALPKTKIPTLQEAYKHFYGHEFSGAHNAMNDTRACKAVYMAHMFGVKA